MVIKNSFVYIFSSAFSKAVPFLLLPLFTTLLTPEEFGLFSIYQVILVFFTALIGMSLQTSITVNFFKVNQKELASYFNNILFILFLNLSLFFLIFCAIDYFFVNFFSIDFSYFYIILPLVFFTVIVEIYTSILRNQQKAVNFFMVEVFGTILKFVLILLFMVFFEKGWLSFIYGNLIGLFLIALYSFQSLLAQKFINFKVGLSKIKIKEILKLCVPLIPHAVGIMIISLSDRLFIEKLIGVEAVGIYAVAYSFGIIVSLFSDAFIKAWTPWFYSKMKELKDKDAKIIVNITYVYIFMMLTLSFIVYVLAYLLIPIMTTVKYHVAIDYVFYIALGYSVQGIYKVFFPYLVFFMKTNYLAIITFFASLSSVFLNYYLINKYGILGAAYTIIFSFIFSSVGVFVVAHKSVKLPWLYFLKENNCEK